MAPEIAINAMVQASVTVVTVLVIINYLVT